MSIKDQVTELFKEMSEWTVKDLTEKTGASKQMIHLILNKLVDNRQIQKLGRTPKTVYRLIKEGTVNVSAELPVITTAESDILQKEWLLVTDLGDLVEGLPAFDQWCRQRKLPTSKTMSEYLLTRRKYQDYHQSDGTINGMEKLKNTSGYEAIWLDQLYYLDFYAIERFGKTRLGALLHYAKQGQNKFLMSVMLKEISPRIADFVQQHKIDAIGFVPPTIRRELQFMKYMQSQLHLAIPVIDIKKISGIIPVPQKSLAKLNERIRNAENTFMVTEQRHFEHILLIDDAVGSGATLNQIAEKIKNKEVAKRITGLAVVGSFKGFDVITDV